MNKSSRFVTRMVLFLALAVGVAALLFGPLLEAFRANPPLNGLILGVLLIGIIYCFRQVLQLAPEIRWIETFRTNQPGLSTQSAPKLLSPTARMLADRKGKVMLDQVSKKLVNTIKDVEKSYKIIILTTTRTSTGPKTMRIRRSVVDLPYLYPPCRSRCLLPTPTGPQPAPPGPPVPRARALVPAK